MVTRQMRGRACGVILAVILLFAAARPLLVEAHPLHTTLTELVVSPDGRSARASIRVFADDFHATIVRRLPPAVSSPKAWDQGAFAYIVERFGISDAAGSAFSLKWCGLRRERDVYWLCIDGALESARGGLRISNGLMQDVFTDQINIVRVTRNRRVMHLLFAHGDRSKSVR